MAVYKSPGVYTREEYWIPVNKGYSTLMRKHKINNIFNLDRDVFSDTFTHVKSGYKKTYKIPVGYKDNKPNLLNTLKKYMSTIKI